MEAAGDAGDWLDRAARLGLLTYGAVHLVVAWLAVQIAFGHRDKTASSSGAMHALAKQPLGGVLVWVVALGLFLLAAWQLIEAAVGHRDDDGADRLRQRLASLGKAVVYAALAVSAVEVAVGSGGSSGSDSATARLMDLPAGRWLVGLAGLVIAAVGIGLLVIAWTDSYADQLDREGRGGDTGRAYLWFGKVGYAAKGVAIGMVGGLFGYAAVTHEPNKSGGLDQALQKVAQEPFGQYLLAALAAGIACYGLFCLARARHLSR